MTAAAVTLPDADAPPAPVRRGYEFELIKLLARWPIRLAVLACWLGPAVLVAVISQQSSLPSDTIFGRWMSQTGWAGSLVVLTFSGTWVLPLLTSLVAGDIFAQEDRLGTWRHLLVAVRAPRRIFAAKALASLTIITLLVAGLACSGIVGGLAAVGNRPLVGLDGHLLAPGQAAHAVLLAWLIALAPTLAFAAIGLLGSVAFGRSPMGLVIPALLALILQIAQLLPLPVVVRVVLPSYGFIAWRGLFTDPAQTGPPIVGVAVSLAVAVAALALAYRLFMRRDFTDLAYDGAGRRALVGAVLPLAAVLAVAAGVIAGATSASSSGIDKAKLDRSLSTAFAHLYRMQTRELHRPRVTEAELRTSASCDKGGGLVADVGAGNDWRCVVSWRLSGATAIGSAIYQLDVTPDGRYRADGDGPQPVNGFFQLRTATGDAPNPLWQFDGSVDLLTPYSLGKADCCGLIAEATIDVAGGLSAEWRGTIAAGAARRALATSVRTFASSTRHAGSMPSCLVGRLPAVAVAVALAGTLVVSGCGSSSGGMSPGPSRPSAAGPVAGSRAGWTVLLAGPSHYGASRSVGPASAHVRWRRALGAPIVAGPVVTASGTAYVAADDGVLRAIDVGTGRDHWTFDGGGSYGSDLSTSALILPSAEILWPGPRDRLFALSPVGRLLWTLTGDGELLTPVIDRPAHLLVVADTTGRVSGYRLGSPTRRPRRVWSRQLTRSSYGNPVVAADGTIYETSGNCLFALSPSGQVRWSVTTPAAVEVSPAIAVNGIVVFGSNDRYEYGVDPDGRVRWKEKIGNFTYSSPVTLPGKRVVFGNHSGQMTILDTDTGQVIRRDTGAGQLWTAAAVDGHGDLYFASRSGHIYGFGASGRRLFDLDAGGQFDSYPALASDGTLLVGDDDGTLFALYR